MNKNKALGSYVIKIIITGNTNHAFKSRKMKIIEELNLKRSIREKEEDKMYHLKLSQFTMSKMSQHINTIHSLRRLNN